MCSWLESIPSHSLCERRKDAQWVHLFLCSRQVPHPDHGLPLGKVFTAGYSTNRYVQFDLCQIRCYPSSLSSLALPAISPDQLQCQDEGIRRVERGSTIVTAVTHDVKLVLQVQPAVHPNEGIHFSLFISHRCPEATWRPFALGHWSWPTYAVTWIGCSSRRPF